MCSILRNVFFCGDGRDSWIWINFDVSRLLIMVILPIVVNNLGVQILISLFISSILLSILISVISCNLSVLNIIPSDVNSAVQIRFRSLQ